MQGNKSTLNGPGLFGLVPVGAPVSEYENGNLPMLHPPVNGTQVFTGSFDASDYLPAYQGKDLDYLTELFKTGGAYVRWLSGPHGILIVTSRGPGDQPVGSGRRLCTV